MKHRFVVLEGADGSGKSMMTRYLEAHPRHQDKFKRLDFGADGETLHRTAAREYAAFLSIFKSLDPTKVHVLDRFIISDIVYNSVLRNEDVTEFKEVWNRFVTEFDVLVVALDRDEVTDYYKDEKIEIAQGFFNKIIHEYSIVCPPRSRVWFHKVVEDSALDFNKVDALATKIVQATLTSVL